MNFTFSEADHKYYLGTKELPGVTRIMSPLTDWSGVNPALLESAGLFGTAVHSTIELHLKDDLDEDSLDENLYNPLLAFKAWQSDFYQFDLTGARIEERGYHNKLLYGGTPDIEADSFIIDLKTRKCQPMKDAIQGAAYDHMTGSGKRDRYCLELKQDASYVFTHLNPTKKSGDEAWSRFRFLLDLHKMKEEVSRWK